MRTNNLKASIKAAVRVVGILSFAAIAAFGATGPSVNLYLIAAPTTTTLPDGTVVPMWGYSCGTPVSGSLVTCAALNPNAGGAWSPVVITVPTGQTLVISLTNNLYFPQTGTATSFIPTSLTIVGQLGGGLGSAPLTVASPTHTAPTVTWSTVGAPGSPTFLPPSQGPRVQSFGTEVAAHGGTILTGVGGVVSEVASPATLTWPATGAQLLPGTYLLESGTHPSIQGPMGLYGMVVVTCAPTDTTSGCTTGTAYPNVSYNADVDLLLSEIDPVQNNAVNTAVNHANFSETEVWSGQPGGCGNPSSSNYQTCYPPAVNYTPLFYLFNGVAFNKTNASLSVFQATPTGVNTTTTSGAKVLVRLVNAGLRMHVPSIVGAMTTPAAIPVTTTAVPGFSLIAEDGNPLPGNQRVQSEVFLAAGKTYDVMVNAPATTTPPALPIFDRELSLSGNIYSRDAGMLAYIGLNNTTLPSGATAAAIANPDTYPNVVPGKTFTVSDGTKGVIANDINVYGVAVSTAPANGTVVLSPNGTFTYTPTGSGWTGDTFYYQANGNGPIAKVTLGLATTEVPGGITVLNTAFTSATAGYISVNTPGVLAGATDTAGYGLSVYLPSVTPTLCSGFHIYPSANGGFNAYLDTPNSSLVTCQFTFQAQSSYGTLSPSTSPNGPATVSVTFPAPSNLTVKVVDGYDKTTPITDYKWIIEEDKTFYVDPSCRTNPPDIHCPLSGPLGNNSPATNIVGTFGVNFHTSDMPFVAQGCTGPKSCEAGQKVYDNGTPCTGGPGVPAGCSTTAGQHVAAVCDVGNGVCRPDTSGTGRTWVKPSQVALDPNKRYYVSVLPGDAADPFGLTGNCSAAVQGGTNPPPCVGHGMGGAPITWAYNATTQLYSQATSVTVLSQPSPYPPGKLSVMIFEDDFPLNGEQDAGGGVDVLAPNEPGLGNFQIHLWDAFGGNGDFTGQMTYDMFNQPLTNSLAGTIDPATHQNACPISPSGTNTFNGATGSGGVSASGTSTPNVIAVTGLTVDASQVGSTLNITGGNGFTNGTYTITAVGSGTWTLNPAIPGNVAASPSASGMQGTQTAPGITGMVVTCPTYEADGTLSPLAGQAVIANLMPGRWGVIATPGADRIARGEEWLQTNTLDGQKAHDVFTRIGEPIYFQEFGPASYHVVIGFANPAIIQNRLTSVCSGLDAYLPGQGNCTNTIKGTVVGERLSRTPDERLYGSDTRAAFSWTRCYVSVGDPDGEDFAFTKCAADGTFSISGLPDGSWRVTTFDQWNDQLVDGLSTPAALGAASNALCTGPTSSTTTCDMGPIAATQWETNLNTVTFIDDNHNGVHDSTETGIPFNSVTVRLRDGSLENNLLTDFTGTANFNETFPLFSWYVVETDVTRYKNSGTHVVYDVGGPADDSKACGAPGYPPCGPGSHKISSYLANTAELVSVPTTLRVPGAVYCANADCTGYSIQNGSSSSAPPSNCTMATDGTGKITCTSILSSGRIDPPWVEVEGWQGFPGQFSFMEFGKIPYAANENGGIQGHVVYASTRPFDDPQMLVQTQWEPLVPHVLINLYQENTAPDGSTSLKLIDHTTTSSFDDWAQGFRALDGMPNMNCPGQWQSDLFYFTLFNQPNYLNTYAAKHPGNNVYNKDAYGAALPDNSQFKCYDGMHNWNQIQPVPYDGMYKFPSVTAVDPNGRPTATNCDPTVCIADPASTTDDNYDPYYAGVPGTGGYPGLPMLPKGKYVVEVVLPPGYELVKEEDKNILIGDNFIAPVTQQFGGLGNVYIIPDQAAIGATYNANNAQNPTQDLGASPRTEAVPVFPFEPVWPCVGQLRVVPDYISLYPASKQVSPFAGSYRRLCDRKEVTLSDQMGAIAKFYIYTSTHKAAKFTGGITDDFTSEFDPFSPQFGEKFAPPNLPVSVKDWTGAETNRVYADEWGSYNGMTYSSWEVNPPNPTGYSPTMMVLCMNDRGSGSTPDPLFQSNYSQFCYELPFMPGTTEYLDTPVVPTSAFSEGYNHPDCAEPANTPAISKVDGDGAHGGPWVSAAGKNITITALGSQTVNNYGYSGPAANGVPFNEQTISRLYGFGATQGTGSVTIGGRTATIVSWSNTQIVATVPSSVPQCPVQQQSRYGGSNAQCGELVITSGNGLQSIDAVTVTIGGKKPTYVSPTTPLSQTGVGSLQQAIDAAEPGDLLILGPGVYSEMVIMWKPVRLQGVGAASVIIDANTQPAGKLDPWRAYVECMFGLATNGQPNTGAAGAAGNIPTTANTNPFDPTGAFQCGATGGIAWFGFNGALNNPQVDRLPLEGILGWDTTVNGNLAQLLQEPTLMGAYEGAGITVLSKGVNIPPGTSSSYYGNGNEATFPTGSVVLGVGDCNGTYPSNFQCNPSSIDGISITDASQGGGGIFVHAWAHNLQIANNRIYDNIGTLSGGINVGQGESPDIYSAGTVNDSDPGSCRNDTLVGLEEPYCFDLNVNVHNNWVSSNTSIGDELFSGTPAGTGGVAFCTGADYYKFNYNWVCGNMSTGDGGGVGHIGYIWNGDIEHNTIIFNQSLNPTIQTNGGGLIVMGAAPDGFNAAGAECGGTIADADCAPGLPDGTGPGLVINANLFMGNAAESGSGGGIRLQSVNGTEINSFAATNRAGTNGSNNGSATHTVDGVAVPNWNTVTITNNIIANNVAGWDGAGISLQDALAVNIINNTIASNDSSATAGPLFNTLGSPLASAPGASYQCLAGCTSSAPQVAGLVAMVNSPNLISNLHAAAASGPLTCPTNNPNCLNFSNPYLANDLFWQNRSFFIGVGSLSATYQQNILSLYVPTWASTHSAPTPTPAPDQPAGDATTAHGTGATITGGTGACTTPAGYWDIGVRGDQGPGQHQSGFMLAPTYSLLTNTVEDAGTHNLSGSANDPNFMSQYCNGSRIPPEAKSLNPNGAGFQVPPGISDATVPNPIFNLTPAATVDEGNNWVNLQWGPLSLTNPVTGTVLGNYALASSSPAIDKISTTAGTFNTTAFPTLKTDFFGNSRPDSSESLIDFGAIESVTATSNAPNASVTGGPLSFGDVVYGNSSANQTLTLHNTGTASLTGINYAFSSGVFSRPGGTCGNATTLAAGSTCTIQVRFSPAAPPAAPNNFSGTLTITATNGTVTNSPVSLTGSGLSPNLSPASHGYGGVTRGSSGTAQTFTLTNTGTVTLTGIAQATLTGANPTEFTIVRANSNCGPIGNGQTVANTTLAAGASCTVQVNFTPSTGQSTGGKSATVSVTSAAGAQTSALTGTAN